MLRVRLHWPMGGILMLKALQQYHRVMHHTPPEVTPKHLGIIPIQVGLVAPGQYGPLKYYIEAAGETSFMHFHKNILSEIFRHLWGDYSAILGGINQNINTGAHSSGIFVGSANTINTNVESECNIRWGKY